MTSEMRNVDIGEMNIADKVQETVPDSNAPKPKHRVQIVASSSKSDDKRPKSDHTIRMRGNVLIQNPAQEWKVRSCELNGSFLTFFRKQKMVAAIDLEQVGDINVLRQIKDSSGQGFIFALHLKEGRYFNVRVSMYDDALNWVKVLVETRDKLRSHQHSRTRSFTAQNDANYSSFTPLTSDFNTSMLVADEPDDNIKVYFDNNQFPPSPIFEANEKYVRPLLSRIPSDITNTSQNSLNSPGSTSSGTNINKLRPGQALTGSSVELTASDVENKVPSSPEGSPSSRVKFNLSPTSTTKEFQPRSLNDGQDGGFGTADEILDEVAEREGEESVKQYNPDTVEGDAQRAEAERNARARLAAQEAERQAEEQAEEARLAAMIASARTARENAEKAVQAKAMREEKMREEQAARQMKLAAEKAAEEERLSTERAAKEARFAAEKVIREKKAAAEKLAREKIQAEQAAAKAIEEEKLAAERALRVAEREAAAKKKMAEQAAAAKESADRKAKLRRGSVSAVGSPGTPSRTKSFVATNSTNSPAGGNASLPSSPQKAPSGPSVVGSLFGEVEEMQFSQENMWRLSRNFDGEKPGHVPPALDLEGIDMTVVESPQSTPEGSKASKTQSESVRSAERRDPNIISPISAAIASPRTNELTVNNVSKHTAQSVDSARESTLPSSFDEVYDTVPRGNAGPTFRNTYSQQQHQQHTSQQSPRRGLSTPERKRRESNLPSLHSPLYHVCVVAICVALLVLGALGGQTYYRRYQAEEAWKAQSLKQLQDLPNVGLPRSAEVLSTASASIGSTGRAAAAATNAAAANAAAASRGGKAAPSPASTAPSSTPASSGLTDKPKLPSNAAQKGVVATESNPHAVARNNNAICKFFSNLLRAPGRFIAGVFSKLASLFR